MVSDYGFMRAKNMKTRLLSLTALLLFTSLLCACPGRRGSASDPAAAQTQTIPPAVAQPTPTGTESMTQTVDVEDSRSEDDGGAITNPQKAKTPAAKPPAKPAAAPKKNTKKH